MNFRILSILILIISFAQTVNGQFENAIVRIQAYKDKRTYNIGTGFFVLLNGRPLIVTCYHVIAKSTEVKIYSKEVGELSGVALVAYDKIRDLALLTFNQQLKKTNFLNVSELTSELTIYPAITMGHPANWQLQSFRVDITSNNLVNNSTLFGNDNSPVFKLSANFDVITLAFDIYGGMSGAPLIVNNKVIGIISGSLNSGGSLAWAIPVRYFKNLTYLNQPTDQFSSIDPYNGLRQNYTHVSKSFKSTMNEQSSSYLLFRSITSEMEAKLKVTDSKEEKLMQSYNELKQIISELRSITPKQFKNVQLLNSGIDKYNAKFTMIQSLHNELRELYHDSAFMSPLDDILENQLTSVLHDTALKNAVVNLISQGDSAESVSYQCSLLLDDIWEIIKKASASVKRSLDKYEETDSYRDFTNWLESLSIYIDSWITYYETSLFQSEKHTEYFYFFKIALEYVFEAKEFTKTSGH